MTNLLPRNNMAYELQNCNIIRDKIWNIENELAGKTGQRRYMKPREGK